MDKAAQQRPMPETWAELRPRPFLATAPARRRLHSTLALWCSEDGDSQRTNRTTSPATGMDLEGWRAAWHRRLSWQRLVHDDQRDEAMMLNDISVLSINTLGQAVVELISKGPKATPGMTLTDWVIVSRYFSVAASISIAWIVAGLLLGHFSQGYGQDPRERCLAALQVWVVSGPVAFACIWLAGVPMGWQDGGLHLLSSLSMILAWRCLESWLTR